MVSGTVFYYVFYDKNPRMNHRGVWMLMKKRSDCYESNADDFASFYNVYRFRWG
jgi:hypothetical protein